MLLSSGGSVVRRAAIHSPEFRTSLKMFVSDRECAGLTVADELRVPYAIVREKDNHLFSVALLETLDAHRIDYLFVFFTRLLHGALLDRYSRRLINFHPSLLPACPGLDGFGDSLSAGALAIGSTVHFIDAGVDTGPQIIQSILPVSPAANREDLRHRIFIQQCRCLIQTHEWLSTGRVGFVGSRVEVKDAVYAFGEYLPNLDSTAALSIDEI